MKLGTQMAHKPHAPMCSASYLTGHWACGNSGGSPEWEEVEGECSWSPLGACSELASLAMPDGEDSTPCWDKKFHTVYIEVTRPLNVSALVTINVCTVMKTDPLVTGGEVGERDGQARLGGGFSSASSSSDELSSVRSITSTFLLLPLLVWDELFLCSDSTGRHESVQKTDQKGQTRFI